LRTNLLILGTDASPERGTLGRTDTIILTTVVPFKPYIGLLSIPRDLWVQVPGVGEQRINTAYFYAESAQAGTGGRAAAQTVRENFGVPVRYYVVIHMGGLVSLVDALGGVDVQLDRPTGGLPAGTHHLDGAAALAFVRNRSIGDDFGRMQGTQAMISALTRRALQPSAWAGLPQFAVALTQTVQTDIPLWQAPRLFFALVRAPLFGFDSRTVTRDMVTPFTTSQGAQVVLPNWDAIRPVLQEMFGR
jgi:LCP family protein required for cell wall assembly